MQIKTNNFELAIDTRGDEQAENLALFLPGLLDSKDYAHIQSHLDVLAQLGYFAISFDMPGTWESSGRLTDYTTTNCLQAVKDVMRHFGNRPTFLLGHSNGGRLTMLSGCNDSIIGYMSIMSAPTFIRKSNYQERAVDWKNNGFQVMEREDPQDFDKMVRLELPYSFCENATHYDAWESLNRCAVPKLFVAGTEDTTAYPEEVKLAYDNAAEPKRMEYVNSEHNYRNYPAKIEAVNKLIEDFAQPLLATRKEAVTGNGF